MSKKTRKPRTPANQAATPQKSSQAVKPDEVDNSKSAGSADGTEIASHPAEGEQAAILSSDETDLPLAVKKSDALDGVTASSSLDAEPARTESATSNTFVDTIRTPGTSISPPSSSHYQSMVPPTDYIDEAWGSDDEDETVITAPPAFPPSTPAPKQPAQEPNKPAESADSVQSPVLESEPTASVTSARSSAAPTPSTSTEPNLPVSSGQTPSRTESVADSGEPVRISAPTSSAPPRFSAPASHTVSLRSSTATPLGARTNVPLSQRSGSGSIHSRPPIPSAANPASEGRPSRVPGSSRSSSVPQSSSTASVTPFEPPPVLLQQKTAVPDPTLTSQSPEVASSAATSTPLVSEPPRVTAVSPSYETKSPAQARTEGRVALAAPTVPISPIASSIPTPRPRRQPLWAVLWIASMAASGAVGWFAKPTPRPVHRDHNDWGRGPERHATRDAVEPLMHKPPEPAAVALPPAQAGQATTEPSNTAAEQASNGGAPATSSSSTLPVVVETESSDRIDVLVKSNPSKVRVWKRGKEIGRTPLVIQVGRGEHRIFEVGTPAFGVRRLSINGDKTEITVNLAVPAGK